MAAAVSNKAEMARLKEDLGKLFSLIDLGELKWLLGITVTWDCNAHTISLCQAWSWSSKKQPTIVTSSTKAIINF